MTPPPRPRAILFDWDNTLVDGWAAIAEGLAAAFTAFGLPVWTEAEVKARVRHSLRQSFPTLFGAEWERARDIFYAAVTARHLAVLRPMPGAGALVAAAAGRVPIAVVSNKQGGLLRAEAAHLHWAPRFCALVGAGDAAADKPDPAPMRLALAACDSPGEGAVWYVGDTGLDMQAARRAGLVGVLLGDAAHDGGVEAAAPDARFQDAGQLAAWLEHHLVPEEQPLAP